MLERVTRWLVNRTSAAERPKPGAMVVPMREDYDHGALTEITPAKAATAIRGLRDGDLAPAMEMFADLEEMDAHLQSEVAKRRMAVTGLDWRIEPASATDEAADEGRATAAADYVRETLRAVGATDAALEHLSLAHGLNLSVVELVWAGSGEGLRLVELVNVPHTRLVFAGRGADVPTLRIVTKDEPVYGIPIGEQPNKFAVHAPRSKCGNPARGGLMVASIVAVLGKKMSLKKWLVFAEMFGIPVRTAKYHSGATAEEKREALNMLKVLGSEAYAVFSEAIELALVERKAGLEPPYESIASFMNAEISKCWVGQTLSTEVGETGGAYAVGKVQERVRQDLRDDDLRKEATTVERDIIRPLVTLRFGADWPMPRFGRVVPDVIDQVQRGQVFECAANRLGISVSLAQVRAELGLNDTEGLTEMEVVPGQRGASPATFGALSSRLQAGGRRLEDPAVGGLPPAVGGWATCRLIANALRRMDPVALIQRWTEAAAQACGTAVDDLVAPLAAAMEARGDEPLSAEGVIEVYAQALPGMSREDLAELMHRATLAAQLAGRETVQEALRRKGRDMAAAGSA